MKPLWIIGLALASMSQFACAQDDWENELVFERNKMAARVPTYSDRSAEEALDGNRDKSRLKSFNGTWKFKLVEKSEDRPTEFMAKDFSGKGWDNIAETSNWELQGHGQSPSS